MLKILIAAYGPDALMRIASLPHPEMEGVEYVVSWQNDGGTEIPSTLLERRDFRIYRTSGSGLSNNRNALLEKAEGGIALISDDDLGYTTAHLETVRRAFADHPEAHFITFRYASKRYPKKYPEEAFDLRRPPKGYYVTSMEMAFNLDKLRADGKAEVLRFDPRFGVNGTLFCCGEEDILLHNLLKAGLKGLYLPVEVCDNPEPTTATRLRDSREMTEAKGAVICHVSPLTWPLRMLSHARRSKTVPRATYIRRWLAGVKKYRNGGGKK